MLNVKKEITKDPYYVDGENAMTLNMLNTFIENGNKVIEP